jgi:hypothetical protein
MGMDAIVFKSLLTVETEFPGCCFERDGETGECEMISTSAAEPPFEPIAEHRRIGNINQVEHLSRHVARRLGRNALLNRLVLHPGGLASGWAGATVDQSRFMAILLEVQMIASDASSDLQQFADDMSCLIEAARRENNPILIT